MNEILHYQEIDMNLKKLNDEIAQNSNRQNALKMQNFLKDSQSRIVALTEKSNKLAKDFSAYKVVYDKMVNNLDVVNKNLGTQDEKKMDSLVEANDSIHDNLNKLDSEITNIIKSCEAVKTEYTTIMKNARTAKSNMDKYKQAYNEFKSQKDAEVSALLKELETAAVKVDKLLLSKYKTKSHDRMPVFVPLVSGRCGGCRMEVSAVAQNKLKSQNYVECENCGRFIYIK